MEDIFVVAGLGNPGDKYEKTRHNAGFDAIDILAGKYGIKVTKLRFKARVGEGTIEGKRVLLLKPHTWMNLSGESVREAVDWYKVPLDRVILIYDDVDLPVGDIRIRARGSSGTHNGMKSVLYQLQSEGFPRIRIGIGKPPEGWELSDYVLGKFTDSERNIMDESIKKAAEAAAAILGLGVEKAMQLFNTSRKARGQDPSVKVLGEVNEVPD